METLTFDEKAHEYRLGERKLPSVTRLLKDAGLIDERWSSDAAMKRGSYVHQMIEFHDEGDLNEQSLDPTLLPYLNAWVQFKKESKCEILSIEERVFNRAYLYAGTLDRRVMVNGKEWVLDVKTGTKMDHHSIQICLYAMCFERPLLRGGIYLKDNGSYKLEPFDDSSDIQVAKAAITLASWKRAHGKA